MHLLRRTPNLLVLYLGSGWSASSAKLAAAFKYSLMVVGFRKGMLLILTPEARSIAYATRRPSFLSIGRCSSVGFSISNRRQ